MKPMQTEQMKFEITEKELSILTVALTILFDQCAKDKSPMKNEVMNLAGKIQKQADSQYKPLAN
jgi:membrane protease subunit (stomatin/prohibitin family)